MWKIAYNLLTLFLFPLFCLYALTQTKIRRNFRERLFGRPKTDDLDGAVWIHAASIGEVVIAQNLVRYLKEHSGLKKFLVTTNTDYARELAASRLTDVPAYALPFDLAVPVRRFYSGSQPLALVIVETEIWPNLIWEAKKQGIPVVIVNGRISDSTVGTYRRFSFFFKHVLSSVDLVLAQSEDHARRFAGVSFGPSRVLATGNIKFYRDVKSPAEASVGRKALTFGSVREKEFDTVRATLTRLVKEFPDYTYYVAPRELNLTETLIGQLSRDFHVSLFSTVKASSATPATAPVVVVDTVGDLMDIYARSALAFVGGSLAPYGGQNMLEPLFFGTPVLFGPYVENFREIAAEILTDGAGIQVHDGTELIDTLTRLLRDVEQREAMGRAGMQLIARQREAMVRTAEVLVEALSQRRSPGRRDRRM